VVIAVVKLLETMAALAMRNMTRSAEIGSVNRSASRILVDSVVWNFWTAWSDRLTVVVVVVSAGGWMMKVMR
jgi:hypothetical protein